MSGPLVGLVGSKNRSLRPYPRSSVDWSLAHITGTTLNGQIGLRPMDVGLLAGILLLVLWAVGTFFFDAPGWITLALNVGVFLLIWRIVARGSTKATTKQ